MIMLYIIVFVIYRLQILYSCVFPVLLIARAVAVSLPAESTKLQSRFILGGPAARIELKGLTSHTVV